MTVNWDYIRESQFPALKNLTYLAAASSSPMIKCAYEKSLEYLNEMLNYGDLRHELFFLHNDVNRKLIAECINANPEEIAFMTNTSAGMHLVAHLFENEKGEILYPSIEFPASIHTFRRMGYPGKKIHATDNKYLIDDYKKGINENTKFIIHSHVQSFNGFRQNLEKLGSLCRDQNLISIINATQSIGGFQIDVKKQKIDILISSALKLPCCGYGIGIVYIKEDLIKERQLPFTSWLSVDDPFALDNENLEVIQKIRSLDSMGGCPNFASLYGIDGSFNFIKHQIGEGSIPNGIKKIEERLIWLTSEFINKLQQFDFKFITPLDLEYRSHIITVEHPKAAKIHRILSKNKIYTTLKRYPQSADETLIRFAFNYYNNLEDIDKTIKTLKIIFEKL
jgi:selenocysteine lyase/cysteine desulfurase